MRTRPRSTWTLIATLPAIALLVVISAATATAQEVFPRENGASCTGMSTTEQDNTDYLNSSSYGAYIRALDDNTDILCPGTRDDRDEENEISTDSQIRIWDSSYSAADPLSCYATIHGFDFSTGTWSRWRDEETSVKAGADELSFDSVNTFDNGDNDFTWYISCRLDQWDRFFWYVLRH